VEAGPRPTGRAVEWKADLLRALCRCDKFKSKARRGAAYFRMVAFFLATINPPGEERFSSWPELSAITDHNL
jgi:hypothetical protein